MLLLVFLVPGLLGALVHGQSTFALNDQIFKLESPLKSSPSSNSACPDRAPPRTGGLGRHASARGAAGRAAGDAGAGAAGGVKSAVNFLSADWLYRLHAEEGDTELKTLVFTEFIPTKEMLRRF